MENITQNNTNTLDDRLNDLRDNISYGFMINPSKTEYNIDCAKELAKQYGIHLLLSNKSLDRPYNKELVALRNAYKNDFSLLSDVLKNNGQEIRKSKTSTKIDKMFASSLIKLAKYLPLPDIYNQNRL